MPCTAVNIYYVSLGGLEVDYICNVCMYKTFAAFTYVTLTKYILLGSYYKTSTYVTWFLRTVHVQ